MFKYQTEVKKLEKSNSKHHAIVYVKSLWGGCN